MLKQYEKHKIKKRKTVSRKKNDVSE